MSYFVYGSTVLQSENGRDFSIASTGYAAFIRRPLELARLDRLEQDLRWRGIQVSVIRKFVRTAPVEEVVLAHENSGRHIQETIEAYIYQYRRRDKILRDLLTPE